MMGKRQWYIAKILTFSMFIDIILIDNSPGQINCFIIPDIFPFSGHFQNDYLVPIPLIQVKFTMYLSITYL